MTNRGVILFGPPASGKDTITAELTRHDDRFALLTKLKAGTGRAAGYRLISHEDLTALRVAGRLVVETHRYGNRYAIDRSDLNTLTQAGRIPIVHMGNTADLQQLRSTVPLKWTTVLLWIPREVCAERSRQRGDSNRSARLEAWEEMAAGLWTSGQAPAFDLTVRTDQAEPAEVARQVIETLKL